MTTFATRLDWRPAGDGRIIAEMDGDDDYLVIDHDHDRPGDAKWYLTWFHSEEHPSGLVLHAEHGADALKGYAESWVADE